MRRLSTSLILVGAVGAAVAVALTVIGWIVVDRLARVGDESLSVAAESLDGLDETLFAASEAIGRTATALERVEGALGTSAGTLGELESILGEMSEIIGTDLADAITAFEDGLPAAADAGDLIDGSLTTLSRLGLLPAPESSLGSAFRSIQASVDGLAGRVREQAQLVAEIDDSVGTVGADVGLVADDLDTIGRSLGRMRVSLDSFGTTSDRTRRLISSARSDLTGGRRLGRVAVLLVGGLAAALMGLLIAVGLRMRGGRVQEVTITLTRAEKAGGGSDALEAKDPGGR